MVHLQLYRFYDKKGLSLGTALVMCVPIYLEEEISFNIPPLWSGDPLQEMANCETMKSIQETVSWLGDGDNDWLDGAVRFWPDERA